MKAQLLLIVILSSSAIIAPVKAEELCLSVTLQKFSGTDVGRRIAEASGNQSNMANVASKLKAGQVFFSQSLNVTDNRTLDETIVVDKKTVKFRCELGQLRNDKLMAALDFSMSGEFCLTNMTSRVQLEVGKKSYVGGSASGESTRLIVVELTRLEKK